MNLSIFSKTLIGQIPTDLHDQIGIYFTAFNFQIKAKSNHRDCWIEYTDFCDVCHSIKDTLLEMPTVCHRRCVSCVYSGKHNDCERCRNYYDEIKDKLIKLLPETLPFGNILYKMKLYNQYSPCYICYSDYSNDKCALCNSEKQKLLKIEHITPCGKIIRYVCKMCCFNYKKEFHCTLTTIVN